MSQVYGAIPSSAKIDIPTAIPSGMLYRIREILGCNREQVKMTPISGQGSVYGGQKIIFTLPPNSLVDLSTLEMIFTGYCQHGGNTGSGNVQKLVQARYFPRNTASIIDSIDIKINGSSKQRIDQYGYIYNILHDFNASDDSLRKNRIGQNATPDNKFWNFSGKTKRRNLYPMGIVDYPETANDKGTYCIRQWLGLLGGNASTNIIHTGMLGDVVCEIVLNSGGILMQSDKPNINTTYTNGASATGGNMIDLTIANSDAGTNAYTTTGLVSAEGSNYYLTDISFNITKYSMPPSFYDAMASVLSSGETYQIYYPNYSIFQGIPTTDKSGSTRFSISTKSLDMVIGTFQVPSRDTISTPLIGGNDYTTYSISPATATYGEEGYATTYYDSLLQAGYPLTLNNSRYFLRNGEYIKQARWLIGGTPLNYETMVEIYNGALRAFNNSQCDMLGGIHKGCASLQHFRTQYFAHILKLNAQTDSDVFTVSGVNAQENSIDITWEVVGGDTASRVDTRILPTNTCTPVLIACYSSHIDISANRSIISYS